MTEPLTALIDCAGIVREMNVKRGSAERMMRDLPKVQVPGLKKVWVRRADVQALIDKHTKAA